MPKRSIPYKPEHLPAKLLVIRKRLGLSQSELARRLEFKASSARISEYEHGIKLPNLLVLLRYSEAARIRMETLIDDRVSLRRFREALQRRKRSR